MDNMVHSDAESIVPTERMLLVPITVRHAPALFESLCDPSLYDFTGDVPPSNTVELEDRFRSWEQRQSPDGSEQWLNWALQLRDSDTLIGYVQATVVDEHAELAWVVVTAYQRRGYATEPSLKIMQWLQERGVLHVKAYIHRDHVASQTVARHPGLQVHSDDLNDDGKEAWILPRA